MGRNCLGYTTEVLVRKIRSLVVEAVMSTDSDITSIGSEATKVFGNSSCHHKTIRNSVEY